MIQCSKWCLLFICFILITSCNQKPNDQLFFRLKNLVNEYSQEAKKRNVKYLTLDFNEVTEFDWDSFHVFDEYVSLDRIESTIGVKWSKGNDVPSGKQRVIFVKGDLVVDYFDYKFEDLPIFFFKCEGVQHVQYMNGKAVFTVFETCNDFGKTYPLIPVECVSGFTRYFDRNCENGQ